MIVLSVHFALDLDNPDYLEEILKRKVVASLFAKWKLMQKFRKFSVIYEHLRDFPKFKETGVEPTRIRK